MRKARQIYLALLVVVVGLLCVTCSQDRGTSTDQTSATVSMSIANSTLAGAVTTVSLEVFDGEELVFSDQADVVAGEFSFGTITLPVGELVFFAEGRSGSGQLLYQGSKVASIISGAVADVDIVLLPTIPMTKLSPYVAEVSVNDQFISTLEIFNLQRFYNGSFRFNYNSNLLRFETTLGTYAGQWGGLIHFSHEEEGELVVSLSRTGENDLVPGGLFSLVDLRFTALSAGTAKLSVEIDSLENLNGRVSEFNSIFVDTQTVIIGGQ